ncbi:MAG: TIGR03663 family protein [Vicinamibacteria bacterium]|nr:TIGR03663 family protein [Vicinamibacteria bacterium]
MKRFSKTDVFGLAILALAIVFRFQDLSLRPFHHDEGVNGFFLTRLLREGAFKYDPSNYHGPTLYYLTLPVVALFGLSDEAVRGTTAFFGTLTVLVLWRFLRPLGSVFALSAMALLATSPGAVFFSRYFIHESLFVAFTLCALAAAPARNAQQRWRFMGAGLVLGLLFATKETAFVSVGAMAGGAVIAAGLVEGRSPLALARAMGPYLREHAEKFMHGFLAFVAAAGLMYSSFFRNPQGVLDAFRTFTFWTKTAVHEHENPWNQHLLWLKEADPALIYLGLSGVVLALLLRRSFVGVMAAVWTILMFSAYSVVGYKTPWLGLNMLLPLAITSGYLLHEVAGLRLLSGRLSLGPAAVLIAAAATGLSATQSYDLERTNYDNEVHPYIYAHTQRSFLEFVDVVEARADALGTGKDTGIAVFAPENWPLAWYLRDYTKTGYWGEFKSDVNVDMYVGSLAQDAPLALKLGSGFDRIGPYNMRGVVDLVLYARKVSP